MSDLWYIDSIDPRAGRAFVARREPDLSAEAAPLEETLAAFIGPPHFFPEFVGSRSVGFGLAHGYGQLGLFRGSREVGFKSLGAVTEFVRRLYLRSSGEGPIEGGNMPLPIDVVPPTPPDLFAGLNPVNPSVPAKDAAIVLVNLAQENAEISHKLSTLSIDDSEDAAFLKNSPGQTSGSAALTRAALRLIFEMIRRAPAKPDAPEFGLWLVNFRRLGEILARMGLWPLVLQKIQKSARIWLQKSGQAGQLFLNSIHLVEGPQLTPWPHLYAGLFFTMAPPVGDPFADLACLPLPSSAAKDLPSGLTSLQGLLLASVAVPSETLAGKDDASHERADLVTFAACYLNLGADRSPYGFQPVASLHSSEKFVESLTDKAFSWLAANLPRLVYHPDVEKIIALTASPHVTTAPEPPSKHETTSIKTYESLTRYRMRGESGMSAGAAG